MEVNQAYENISKNDSLIGVGLTEDSMIVSNKAKYLTFKIPFDTIENNDWDTLYGVLSGEREPNSISHMSRIVGYMSTINNWNASKLEELKDRHLGEYQVS